MLNVSQDTALDYVCKIIKVDKDVLTKFITTYSDDILNIIYSLVNKESKKQEISFDYACQVLDIEEVDPKGLRSSHVNDIIEIFFTLINDEKKNNDKKQLANLINAKNKILYEIVRNETTGHEVFEFDLDLQKYYHGNQCKHCNGAGIKVVEAPGIIRNMDKCPDCLGTGIQHKECKDCYGTGWDRGKICSTCRGKRRIPFRKNAKRKCSYCNGNRFINRRVDTGIILTYVNCTVCKGFGEITLSKLLKE